MVCEGTINILSTENSAHILKHVSQNLFANRIHKKHVCQPTNSLTKKFLPRPYLDCFQVSGEVLAYVNRLSDYLFTAARVAAHEEGGDEAFEKP